MAYIIANFIVAIYAIIAGKGYKAFSFHNIDRCKLKEMIRYIACKLKGQPLEINHH